MRRRSPRLLTARAIPPASGVSVDPERHFFLDTDALNGVLRALNVDDLLNAAQVSVTLRAAVTALVDCPSYLDNFWNTYWASWHNSCGVSYPALMFMLRVDPSRWARATLNDLQQGSIESPRATTDESNTQHRTERPWPRQTAEGGPELCLAELSQPGQRYMTLAAFELSFDGRNEVEAVPDHCPMTGDTASCDLILRQFGDGKGRIRGWPYRSAMFDGPGSYEPSGMFLNAQTECVIAGTEVFLRCSGRAHDTRRRYAEDSECNVGRLRRVGAGQTFRVEVIEENTHQGSAEITTRTGDLELYLGGVCHLLRPVPTGAIVHDPLSLTNCHALEDDPQADDEEWWEDPGTEDSDEDEHAMAGWYSFFDHDGQPLIDM